MKIVELIIFFQGTLDILEWIRMDPISEEKTAISDFNEDFTMRFCALHFYLWKSPWKFNQTEKTAIHGYFPYLSVRDIKEATTELDFLAFIRSYHTNLFPLHLRARMKYLISQQHLPASFKLARNSIVIFNFPNWRWKGGKKCECFIHHESRIHASINLT